MIPLDFNAMKETKKFKFFFLTTIRGHTRSLTRTHTQEKNISDRKIIFPIRSNEWSNRKISDTETTSGFFPGNFVLIQEFFLKRKSGEFFFEWIKFFFQRDEFLRGVKQMLLSFNKITRNFGKIIMSPRRNESKKLSNILFLKEKNFVF